MGALETVTQLKRRGLSEEEIASSMMQDGISPKEVADAISQARIKEMISQDNTNMDNAPSPGGYAQQNVQEMDILPKEDTYTPAPEREAPIQQQSYPPAEYQENPYAESSYAPAQYSQGGYDTNTFIEISEQVFSEKISPIQKRIDELNEIKAIANIRLENISERLKRIESIIDKMQISILEEVGNYGKNISNLKKEVEMVEDSFSKVVNNIADKKYSSKKSSKR